MKNKQLIENFKIEELEQRYEMGWIDSVKVGVQYEQVNVSATFDVS